MRFSPAYFEDEVRDGFYVPSIMKRAWAAQLEILEDIDKVCQMYDIQYFADMGTLLGAVRHGGFIPWDDDVDICMKRKDYDKFISVAEKELPECYYLLNCHNEYNGEIYWDFMTRVVNQHQISFEEAHLTKFHGFPYVSGVDIFSLDFMAPTEEQEAERIGRISLASDLIEAIDDGIADNELEEQLYQVEQMCSVRIDRKKNIKQQLYILIERFFALYNEHEAEVIAMLPLGFEKPRHRFPKKYYEEVIKLPFENTEIPVPAAYEAILKKKYGNYLKIARKGGAHEYPFYKRQEEVLEKEKGIKFLHYKVPETSLDGKCGENGK